MTRPEVQGEKRWPMALTLCIAVALTVSLPLRFSWGPSWIFPVIQVVLLVSVIIADPGRIDRRTRATRALNIGLVAILVAKATGATVRLIVDLIRGGPETNSAALLLRVGSVVWLLIIISFAFLYWVFDSGGAEARAGRTTPFPDLAFPEQLNPGVTPPGWRPQFFDYLYLGFTNATAFSPTDVMPLKHWAKLAMAVQATSSLVLLGLVIARAVNILK
jgi:uncharacterized membrane protein